MIEIERWIGRARRCGVRGAGRTRVGPFLSAGGWEGCCAGRCCRESIVLLSGSFDEDW